MMDDLLWPTIRDRMRYLVQLRHYDMVQLRFLLQYHGTHHTYAYQDRLDLIKYEITQRTAKETSSVKRSTISQRAALARGRKELRARRQKRSVRV